MGQRQWLRLSGLVVVLLLAGSLGCLAGRPLWRRWQDARALAQVREFSAQRDYPDALIALRRATELAPSDLQTWREAARLFSEIGSPEVITAREQMARLAPQNPAVQQALVLDALRFGETGIARDTLSQFDDAARREVLFHRLAATLALALGQSDELKTHLAAIIAARPEDVSARFNFAVVRLWSERPAEAAAALAELENLTARPAVRIRAAIELLQHAARQRDADRLARVVALLSQRFAANAPAGLTGDAMRDWAALLEALRAAAGTPTDTALLARWLGDIGQRRETLLWLESLPEARQTAAPVADVAAELSAEANDLPRLCAGLNRGAWGDVPGEAVLLAGASHWQSLQADPVHGQATWEDAVTVCGDSLSGLRVLARLATTWHNPAGAASALVALIARNPKALWAYDALRASYVAQRDTAKLEQLYASWSRQAPDDPLVAAAFVTLSAVLDHTTPELSAQAISLQTAWPHVPAIAIACAATLWRQKSPAQALSILKALPANEQASPAAAFWLALVQADLNLKAEAVASLARADQPGMLNEERALLRQAEAKVGLKSTLPE
jgi:predicted Zn-dependent protease